MPSNKIRKAIGAVKDQTSIGLAKVSGGGATNLDVAVLKATSHDEVPVEERYVTEVLLLISSSSYHARTCVLALSRRLARTRNWVVALKALGLVFRALQEGGPHFPQEALAAIRRRVRLLDLSGFRDDSPSSPWDYTTFVRTFALYLDERLFCVIMGTLDNPDRRRRVTAAAAAASGTADGLCDVDPEAILDRIAARQRLLDRAIAARPTGPAKNHRLVKISLYTMVRESFDLYREVSDEMALLLGSFSQLQPGPRLGAYTACLIAAKQFEELAAFYGSCKSIGVGRSSEYPNVQKISDALLETLNELLKDNQASSALTMTPAAGEAEDPQETPEFDTSRSKLQVPNGALVGDSESSKQSSPPEGRSQTNASGDDHRENLVVSDLVVFDDQPEPSSKADEWEHVLTESATGISGRGSYSFSEVSGRVSPPATRYNRASICVPNQDYSSNPFLLDDVSERSSSFVAWSSPLPWMPPPTFSAVAAQQQQPGTNPFSSPLRISPSSLVQTLDMPAKQHLLLQEQQMWMQHQSKIISRHIAS